MIKVRTPWCVYAPRPQTARLCFTVWPQQKDLSTHFRPQRVKTTKPQEPLNSNFLRSPPLPAPPIFLQEQSASTPAALPPLWIRRGTQTDQSAQEVRPGWQTAELSSSVQHMAAATSDAACGAPLPKACSELWAAVLERWVLYGVICFAFT